MSLIPPNNPEIDLLLCCARANINPEIAERINLLVQKDIDWEYLSVEAIRQRVMPLLYRNLKSVCFNVVPNEIMEQFRNYYLSNAARNLNLTNKLLEVLELLEVDMLAVPFKGPVLAKYVYGDITMRQFVDLDILIHQGDAIKARNLLMTNGFQPEINLDNRQFDIYIKTEYGLEFICDESRVNIELHWKLIDRHFSFPISIELFEKQLEFTDLEGKDVHNFSPEDLLLYMCIHGGKHCWDSLEWICCVAELIQTTTALNWVRVKNMARKLYCERIFSLGLFLANDLLGANIPTKILKNLKANPKIRSLAEQVYSNLFQKSDALIKPIISNRFYSFHIKARDRLPDKIRHIVLIAISPTKEDWKRFPLPASISFLHYALRPIRLAFELVVLFFVKLLKLHSSRGSTRIF